MNSIASMRKASPIPQTPGRCPAKPWFPTKKILPRLAHALGRWCGGPVLALAALLPAAAWAASPVVLLTDSLDGTGSPDTMNLNFNLPAREGGSLTPVSWDRNGNVQVGNTGEPHDSGNVLLCAFGGDGALLYDFNQARSAGGLKISFDLDSNSHTDYGDTTTWGAVNLGMSFGDRHIFVNGGNPHFGILFRANGGVQAFDGGTVVAGGNWAADGNYSGQLHHFDIVLTGPGDGNPFDGSGHTQIDVYADNAATPFLTWTKSGGYSDNFINFAGDHIVDFDNVSITQLDAPAGAEDPWKAAAWSDDASTGVDASYTYTHAFNFGQTDAVINNVMFTHLWVLSPSVADRFSTANLGGSYPNDTGNNLTSGGSRTLANDFLYGGNPDSLTLSGLVPGRKYVLSLYSTAWDSTPSQRLLLFSDGTGTAQRIFDQDTYRSPSARGGIVITYTYTATAETETITVTPFVANSSFHIYGFTNREAAAATTNPWTYAQWTSDATSGVSPAYTYTHAYHFGSSASPTINTVGFTGVNGGNPSVSGRFTTAGLPNGPVGDGGKVTGSGAVLASSFIYGGDPETLTLQGLTPGKDYMLSIFSTAWDAPGNRFISFSGAGGQRTIDQDTFAGTGIVFSYAYTADSSGTVTVQTTPLASGNTCHFYGFANRETTKTPVPVTFTLQPQSISVTEGLDVTFHVEAVGEPAPGYLWLKNGLPLAPPITANTLSLSAVTTADQGDYQAVASNSSGAVTSLVATLKVGLPMANPSFEVDTFTNYPGYISTNGPITGWTATIPDREGINPGPTFGPFTDNGAIPHGRQAAFLQGGSLSQVVSGFTIGADYYLEYYEDARNCCGGTAGITVTVSDGDQALTVVPPHAITPVLGINPYHHLLSYPFKATAASLTITFTKTDFVPGDSTALLDNICILPMPANTPPQVLIPPQTTYGTMLGSASFDAVAAGSSPLSYQWQKNGVAIPGATAPALTLGNLTLNDDADYSLVVTNSSGSTTSAVAHLIIITPLNNLFNTGVDSNRVPLAGGTVDPHFTLVVNPDTASSGALVQSAPPGAWMANSGTSVWIGPRADTSGAAGGDYTYRYTLDLTGRDPSQVYIQGLWTSDNIGLDILVNGSGTANGNAGAFGSWYSFVVASSNATFVAGLNTIDFKVNNAGAGYTGLRMEFAVSHARLAPGSAPVMILQPQGGDVTLGENVVLSGNAIGSAPLAFQWFKNGAAISGQTGPLLSLPNFAASDSADYTLIITNHFGSVTSALATLQQVYLPLVGLFNTGVDNTGALAPRGSVDLHYTLEASPDPLYPGPAALVLFDGVWPVGGGTYMENGPASAWISPALNGTNLAGGNYTYRTAFQLPAGLDPATAWIQGKWASDNGIVDILLNGTTLAPSGSGNFTSFSGFTGSYGFVPGSNSLEFIVANGDGSPHAFRAELKGGAMTLPTTAPVISVQPQSQLVQQNDNVVFSVTTTNGRPTYYQWYFEGFDLPGETHATLRLSAVNQFDQQGNYWVVLGNDFGEVTSDAGFLTINLPPVTANASLATIAGQPASLAVSALLAGCWDPDVDPVSLASVSNSTNGANVTIVGPDVVYTPLPGFVGLDQFSFTVSDGRGGASAGLVIAEVYPGQVAAPNIVSIQAGAGLVQFTFAGIPGRSYGIERALVITGPWTNIATVVASPTGFTPMTDSDPPPGAAFYRTR